MKLVTFNLWFGSFRIFERLDYTLGLLRSLKPDVIALQEVSSDTFEPIIDFFSDFHPSQDGWESGGTLLLSREKPLRVGRQPLTSSFGRELLWIELADLTVATVHLESLKRNTAVRLTQLKEVFEHLEQFPSLALLGDFNFCASWPENGYIDPTFTDLWPFLHPAEPGYTEDTTINRMRWEQKLEHKQVRFDRILVRGPWRPESIELLGTEALPHLPDAFPSDHFGLVAQLCADADYVPPRRLRSLMLLGRDHLDYGEYRLLELEQAVGVISVGADPESPSLGFKADKEFCNEDALLVVEQEGRYLCVVADAHFGLESSHYFVQALAALARVPEEVSELYSLLMGLRNEQLFDEGYSSTTLVVCVYLPEAGIGFGYSMGDSTVATISEQGYQQHNRHTADFLRAGEMVLYDPFEINVEPGSMLLLFTDGIDECHYRQPETSIRPEHLQTLWAEVQPDHKRFAELTCKLALDGILDNPGGQDNIALIVLK